MHPAKRRRLEQSTSTLTKPFRSPLRVEVKKQLSTEDGRDHSQSSTDTDAHAAQPASSPVRKTPTTALPTSSQSSPAKPVTTSIITSLPYPTVKPPYSAIPTTRSTKPKSPEYLALQKQHTRLLTEVSALRKSIDTAQQALSLESSDQDAELERLVAKWRGIAREAAEELFRVAKDKVNRMGGVGVWRERTRRRNDEAQQGFNSGWGPLDGDGEIDEEKLTEEQRDALAQMREEADREREIYAQLGKEDGDKSPGGAKEERDDEVCLLPTPPVSFHAFRATPTA